MNDLKTNEYSEFITSCECGSADFYTAKKIDNEWQEIEPIEQWDAWTCVCGALYTDNGKFIEKAKVKLLN